MVILKNKKIKEKKNGNLVSGRTSTLNAGSLALEYTLIAWIVNLANDKFKTEIVPKEWGFSGIRHNSSLSETVTKCNFGQVINLNFFPSGIRLSHVPHWVPWIMRLCVPVHRHGRAAPGQVTSKWWLLHGSFGFGAKEAGRTLDQQQKQQSKHWNISNYYYFYLK